MPNNQQRQDQPREQGVPKKAIRVLSIDGGGIRGIAVAEILDRIEKENKGKLIHQLFDVIVGTSTGGLLSVLLTVEVPPVPEIPDNLEGKALEKAQKKQDRQIAIRKELELPLNEARVLQAWQIKKLYELRAKEIFEENANWLHKMLHNTYLFQKAMHLIMRIWSSKYEKGENLKQIVKALYINNGFEQARTCTGVVVTERGYGASLLLNSTNAKVQGRHNYHNTLSLAKLVRATSAAPTYFKAVHIHNPCVSKHEKGKPAKTKDDTDRETAEMEKISGLWDKEVLDHKFCKRQVLFFEDGGVTCNNPSIKGYRYAKELLKLHGQNPSEYEFQMYSLGTGALKYDQEDPAQEIIRNLEKKHADSGFWDILNRLILKDPFNIDRMSYRNHQEMQQRLKFLEKKTPGIQHKYFRLQFVLDEDVLGKMDDSSKENIDKLVGAAIKCTSPNPEIGNPVFKQIIDCLKEDVVRPKGLDKVKPNIKSELLQCTFGMAIKGSETCELTTQAQ